MALHTNEDLKMRQALPLSMKVAMTKTRIHEWVSYYGESGVYIAFSGGKDSTVLLDIVRSEYPDIEAVFVDVPTQYPELKTFATSFPNVTVIRPKLSYMQVVEKYGFPFISKEVAESVSGARKYLTQILRDENLGQSVSQSDLNIGTTTIGSLDKESTVNFLIPLVKYQRQIIRQYPILLGGGTITSIANSEEFANILNDRMTNKKGGNNQRLAILLGIYTKDQSHPIKANIPSEDRSIFSQEKYSFFLNAPFEISNKCCDVMKKSPAHKYYRDTGKAPIIATMASESRLRTQKWMQNGCNGFDLKIPTSTPMSFWTEQDVLLYIKLHNLPICSVYGDIVEDYETEGQVQGQMSFTDYSDEYGLFDIGNPPLKTTGCSRTGCVLCGFGAHCKGDTRFIDLKNTHEGLYGLLDKVQNNGVTMREAIDWINENGNLNIKY